MLGVTDNLIKTDTSMMHTWQPVSIKIEWMCKDFYFLLPPYATEEIMMWGFTKACYWKLWICQWELPAGTHLGRGVDPDGRIEKDVVTQLLQEWCSMC